MKRILFIILFISNLSTAQEFITKPVFDSILVSFVDSARELTLKYAQEKEIKRDPYESTSEYKKRIEQFNKKLKEKFFAIKLKSLEDFYLENSKVYKVLIDIDSVHYNADEEKADLFFDKINIPHNLGVPMLHTYVEPVFYLPDTWTSKEGFGLIPREIPIKRKLAKENDIIKTKGRLELDFSFQEEEMFPVIILLQAKWKNEDKYLWTWKGKAKIPKSDLRGELKGQF